MWPYYYEASYPLYAEAAKNLINEGFWSREFVGEKVLGYMFVLVQLGSSGAYLRMSHPDGGRTLQVQHFNHRTSSVDETLRNYDTIVAQNADTNLPSVHAIIGGIDEDDTLLLSRTSNRHEMAIVGYAAETSELSDKVYTLQAN